MANPTASCLARIVALFSLAVASPALAQEARPDAASGVQEVVAPRLISAIEIDLAPGTAVPGGGVEVLLTVGVDGLAGDAEIVTEPLEAVVIEAVLGAIGKMRFEPARRGDEALPARIRFRFVIAAGERGEGAGSGAGAEAEAGADAGSDAETDAGAEAGSETDAEAATGTATGSGGRLGEDTQSEEAYYDAVMRARARVDKPQAGAATQVKLRAEELSVVPGTFGEPLRVVATLPGVARTPFGIGFFAVRGASLQNTGFLVDGFPVPLLYHLGAGPAILSSRLVDGLDFYPGGYPVQYGRYNAGIIALTTAPPPTDRLQFEFEVDLLRASALAVVPIEGGRGSLAVAFRRSYYDLILPLITDDITLFYADYQLRLDYALTERLRLSLFVFGSRDSLQFSQEVGAGQTLGQTSGGLTYDFDRVMLSLEYRTSAELRLRWSGTAGPSSIDFGRESTTDSALGVDTSSLRIGQRVEAIYAPSTQLQTTLGVEENIWINELVGQAPSFGELPGVPAPNGDRESIEVADRLSELSAAPYLEQVLRPGRFEISAGARAEYYRYGDVSTWVGEPRGVVRYEVVDDVTLKLASGLFSQAPLPFQLNRSFGNPELKPNRAWQNSLGSELKLPASLEVDTTLFYNRMWQLSRASGRPTIDDDGTPVTRFFADDGEGRAYGWELLLRRKVEEGLFGWISYTLSRSERFIEGGGTAVFFFDQTHVLNLAASYKVGDFRFGGRFTLTSGRPTLDLRAADDGRNVVYDADADDYRVESDGARVRLPLFHQLDVRVDYDMTFGPFDGGVFLDVINVYSAQNAEGYLYEYDFSQRGQVPGIPFLPTIGIRGVLR